MKLFIYYILAIAIGFVLCLIVVAEMEYVSSLVLGCLAGFASSSFAYKCFYGGQK